MTIRRPVAFVIACVALLAQGCAGQGPAPRQAPLVSMALENASSFGPRPAIAEPEQLHRLSDRQAGKFLDFMDAARNDAYPRHRRLARYLELATRNFQYDGDTLTAAETLEAGKGNCLSLAILTTALARLAGIEIGYQLMDDVPVYSWNGSVVTKGLHIRTVIYDPDWVEKKGLLVLARPGITVDYFPTDRERFVRNMDSGDYLAMYYRNIAAEALSAGDLDTAYWQAVSSLAFQPDSSAAVNMLAVINRRSGNVEQAERLYRFGIEHAHDKLSLLKNYRLLLVESGRQQEADRVERQLESIPDPSPFHWFQLARTYFADGDYARAIRYYNRAIELAPYLHEAYLGIAQSSFQTGQRHLAIKALESAIDVVQKASTRNLYQAKLDALSARPEDL